MKKVAVLFGGNSSERDVSLHTGLAVIEAIKDDYNIESINIDHDYTSLHKKLLDIDVVFIALHGGYGEDGRLQEYFDKHNIKYTGSNSKASQIAMDKHRTKLIAKKNHIPVLNWLIIDDINNYNLDKLKFPLIIKPNDGGSTIGLYYCKNINDFKINIQKSFNPSKVSMVEEYVKAREISVPILDGQVLPIIEIFPKAFLYDYESKYKSNGSKYEVPAQIKDSISRKLANDALLIYNKIGCRHYARVDFLLSNDSYYLLEINTLPGLTSTSLLPKSASKIGLSYKSLVKKIIDLSFFS
tara:strand:- start:46 stop:939 length:894 start_codon:yes stop_codon:yes gene_type:complete